MNGAEISVEDHGYFSVNVRPKSIVGFALLGMGVALLSDVPSRQETLYLVCKGLITCLFLISLFAPSRSGIILFSALMLAGLDNVQASSEMLAMGVFKTASIWNMDIGPIHPGWVVAIGIIAHIIKTEAVKLDRTVVFALIWYATIPVFTAVIYGAPYLMEIIVDIKIVVTLLLSIIMYRSFLSTSPDRLGLLAAVFMGILLGRHSLDLIYWFVGYGSVLSGIMNRVSVDSAKGGLVFIMLYSIYMIIMQKRIISGSIIAIFSFLLVVVFATRLLWVTAFMGFGAMLFMFRLKRNIVTIAIVATFVFVSIYALQHFRPETAEVVAFRAETFTKGQKGAGGGYIARLDPLRYGEILNSTTATIKRGALLWGSGYGSYYTDDVVAFRENLVDAFPEHSAKTGKFYRIHNYFFHMFFKYGLIGLTIITSLWMVPAWKAYKILRHTPSLMNGIPLVFVAFTLTSMIQMFWSGKGMFINGLVIAVLYTFTERYQLTQDYELGRERFAASDYE